MTVVDFDTEHFTNAPLRTYRVRLDLVRFIRAENAADAADAGSAGIQRVDYATVSSAVVEHVAIAAATAAPYPHAGEENLWRVATGVDAAITAESADLASEAAHQLVAVTPTAQGGDVFEYELQIDTPTAA